MKEDSRKHIIFIIRSPTCHLSLGLVLGPVVLWESYGKISFD